ncbi:MAG: putative DNA binding domain-containing protein [Prevotella sp.]|nr:putative DNA binding domain-containing protein [Prevotella sp.]
MSSWQDKAIKALEGSLHPIPQELNTIDWKCALSDKSERLAQHICAFSNTANGGFLAFGVNNDTTFASLSKEEIEEITNKLGNIAKNNLAWSVQLEHAVAEYQGHAILFIRIPEQTNKPIYLRGKDIYEAYIRSAGHTVKMSKEQVHELIAQSHGLSFEDRVAKSGVSIEEVKNLLDCPKMFELLNKNMPSDKLQMMKLMEEYGLIAERDELYDILNLGAILFAKQLKDFPTLKGKEIIVRRYQGTNNRILSLEYTCQTGYAIGFKDLVDFVNKNTSTESIEIQREAVPSYPIVAIRELTANMMVHQDTAIKGMPLTIEIFTNRLTFTNPGSSLNDVNRLIDLPPHSRNESMAQMMLLMDMCERRGSGIDRATDAISQMKLPAYKAQSGDDYTRITLFPKKKVSEMTREERIAVCYQHACLLYEDGIAINNQIVRERFNLNTKQSVMASRILADTLDSGLIKMKDPETESKRYTSYIPYYG